MSPEPAEQRLLDVLGQLGIAWERREHPAVFTVEQAEQHWKDVTGLHLKNLFLRNERGNRQYLVILEASKRADLRTLAALLGEDRFSFGSPARLKRCLGVDPGSVSPFNLINDPGHAVEVVMDEDIRNAEKVNFHPNVNTVTLTIRTEDLFRFLEWTGHAVRFLSF